jgi:hypothetical protein
MSVREVSNNKLRGMFKKLDQSTLEVCDNDDHRRIEEKDIETLMELARGYSSP